MMRYLSIPLLCFFLFTCNQENSKAPTESDSWISLFNGKDLEGWTMKIAGHPLGENFGNTFRVQDKILSIRYDQYGDNFDNRFGALYFNKKLTNYRLKVEYRFVGETAPGAPEWGYRDSGVQYHSQSPSSLTLDQSFPICLEYNLHGGNGTDDRPVGEICANGTQVEINGKKNESFCTPATVKRTFHGDQWVTLEIEVKDNKISHFVNGEEILKYKNPTYNPDHELGKTFIINGDASVRSGYISLQSNSHPIDFRNIALLEY
jgi:3-keto-disaccharide hydrolase